MTNCLSLIVSLIVVDIVGSLGMQYNESRARDFAKLAYAAYCGTRPLESWSCGLMCNGLDVQRVRVCNGATTRAFLGIWMQDCIVSFEGTSDFWSAMTDAHLWLTTAGFPACPGCAVHRGFLDEYKSLKGCVVDNLEQLGCPTGSSIRTTGHSLGAAVSTIAMLDLDHDGWKISESYDFGKPRVGDKSFAEFWNHKFSDVSYRITHHMDPVVNAPLMSFGIDLSYRHTEPEVFYDGTVSQGFSICHEEKTSCAEKYWDVAQDAFHVLDHMNYMDLDAINDGCHGDSKLYKHCAACISPDQWLDHTWCYKDNQCWHTGNPLNPCTPEQCVANNTKSQCGCSTCDDPRCYVTVPSGSTLAV